MGVVYKARDPQIGRMVALKTITSGLADNPDLLERFYQEARSAGGLEHPNIVTIYDLGKEGDIPYIAMQFLDGASLEKIIARQSPLALSLKLGYIVKVCQALDYAHRHGVVHRDIKPGNVVVTNEGAVKVVDFGIARVVDAAKTQTGMLIGTLGYMSPQQVRGERADARSDIWAVGVMFYELITGVRPFSGDNHAALMFNIIDKEPRPIRDLAPDCPPEVEGVIQRMVTKEAAARYQSMEEVLFDLDPVWKRIQHSTVVGLVADSEQLFEARDMARAQELLRKALMIDTGNAHAKTLLEKVNAEIRRSQILPKVQSLVAKGHELLSAGNYQEAKAEAEDALQLDSNFQPARELLAAVQAANERAVLLQERLRITKQRLAEGALTEATLSLEKALELDRDSPQALDLRRQIQEERARREKRKRLTESLQAARGLWTQARYDECIALLVTLRQDFPNEIEISKLLETARQDQTEEQRQSKLSEVRKHLTAQRYAEARAILDPLLKLTPDDPTVQNLRTLVVQGQEEQARQQRFQVELAALRAAVGESKYEEAVARGEKLLREYPGEFELEELVGFARSELAGVQQKRLLEDRVQRVRKSMDQNRFQEALDAARRALLEFPGNVDLLILQEQAQTSQKEKERREALDKRIRQMKSMINREDLSDAIGLARETLAQLGEDTDVTQLLHAAEMERTQREKQKKEAQDLFQEIEKRKTTPQPPSPSMPPAQTWPPTTPGQPARDYVWQPAAPQQSASAVPQAAAPPITTTSMGSSATAFGVSPALEPPPAPLPPQIAPPSIPSPKLAKPGKHHDRPSPTPEGSAAQLFAPEIETEQLAVDNRASLPPIMQGTVVPTAQRIPQLFWENPLAVSALAVVLLASLAGILYSRFHTTKPLPTVISTTEQALLDQAEQPFRASPRLFAESLSRYQSLLIHKSIAAKAQERIREIQALQKQESDWMEQGKQAQAQGPKGYDEALNDYEHAKQINGDREKDAEDAIEVVKRLKKGENLAGVALENFKRAEGFAEQKQWAHAKSLYQSVVGASEAPPDLRTRAENGVKKASDHLDEETLWGRAQEAHRNKQYDEAKSVAQQVASKNLDHRREAEGLVKQIDAELAAKSASLTEDNTFLNLKRQLAQSANNANELNALVPKFEAIAANNGKHAQEAREIARNEIPAYLKEIDNKIRIAKDREEAEKWNQTQADCDKTLNSTDKGAIASLKERLNPFLDGPYAAQAKVCLGRINAALTAPPQPSKPPDTPVVPTSDSNSAINAVFEALSRAFADRNIKEVTQVWPGIPKKDADTLKRSFEGTKRFSRKFTPAKIIPNGDTAEAEGSWAGTYDTGSELTSSKGMFKASLRKQQFGWVITKLDIF